MFNFFKKYFEAEGRRTLTWQFNSVNKLLDDKLNEQKK